MEFVGPTWGQLSSSQRRLSRTKLWLTAPGASWARSSGATPLHLHCTIPWRALSTPPHRKQNTRLHRQCIASQPVAASGGARSRLSGRGGQVPTGGRIPARLGALPCMLAGSLHRPSCPPKRCTSGTGAASGARQTSQRAYRQRPRRRARLGTVHTGYRCAMAHNCRTGTRRVSGANECRMDTWAGRGSQVGLRATKAVIGLD